MSELSPSRRPHKKDWAPTRTALDSLLTWLDQGTNSEGQTYLEMQRRLVAYFGRKNCLAPDELADETLNRVMRRLEEEGAIESETPAKYCYIVARLVFLEHLRRLRKSDELINEGRVASSNIDLEFENYDEKARTDRLLACLERCAGKLEPRNQEIITRYYVGAGRRKIENRSTLANELGITVNALSIRACRIRDKLEACVKECVSTK